MKDSGAVKVLIKQFADKRKKGIISPTTDEAFALGMNTMRHCILNMISDATKGERIGEFDRGQDDALLWVAQELRILYDEN